MSGWLILALVIAAVVAAYTFGYTDGQRRRMSDVADAIEAARVATGCAEYALLVSSRENTDDAINAISSFRTSLARLDGAA